MSPTTFLERLPRTRLGLGPWTPPSFPVCVGAGFLVGSAVAEAASGVGGQSPLLTAVIAAASAAAFVAVGLVTKAVYGAEVYVFYHHALATMAVAALVVGLAGAPLLPYLDLAALGTCAALVSVRVGCLLVGCCHGRPARRGVRYGAAHAEAGFPACYVGVPLFPVQAVEAAWALCLTAVAAFAVLAYYPPGAVLAFCATAYAAGRMVLELVRGDAGRAMALGLSQAQWVSSAVLLSVAVFTAAGVLPGSWWQLAALAVATLAAAAVAARRRRRGGRSGVENPRHIQELAELLGHLEALIAAGDHSVHVHTTSFGLMVSAALSDDGRQPVRHYAFSGRDRPLSGPAADAIADLISRLRCDGRRGSLIAGPTGTFHLVIDEPASVASAPAGNPAPVSPVPAA